MKNAVLVHGMPSKSQYELLKLFGLKVSRLHWFGWLNRQLQKSGYSVHAPEMPNSYKPDYEVWKREVEKVKIGKDTLCVGHSCGGGFWLRYLSENSKLQVGKVVLVAPWLDVPGKIAPEFFDFKLDKDLVKRTAGLTVIYSDNDMKAIDMSVDKIKKEVEGINYKVMPGYGHFTIFKMKTTKFPELLQECLSLHS